MSHRITFVDNERSTCASCAGRLVLDTEKGEMICNRCGIVVNTMYNIDENSQRKITSLNFENLALVEPTSLMMYEVGLPTFIDEKNVDASGKQICISAEMGKLRRLNKFVISNDSRTRNLKKAVREIRRITDILGMSSLIAERAGYIYRKALNQKLIKGRSITGVVTAAIYMACKDAGILFPLDRLEVLAENCTKRHIMHYYKILLRHMKMRSDIPAPSRHVSKIATDARLSVKAERKAVDILLKVERDPILAGKKPISLAAAAVYLAALQTGQRTTQLRIAIASGITTITIRKRCAEISRILKQQIDASIPNESDKSEDLISYREHNIPILAYPTLS